MGSIRTVSAVASRAILYPARHIRWKIIAPYAILVVLLAGAGTYIATSLVTGSLEERFENQLAEASRVTSDAVVRRERQHLAVVRSAAFTEGTAEAVKSGDGAALERLLEPLAANDRTELLEVLDARGQRVYGARLADDETLTYESLAGETDRSSWAAVESVLSQREDELGDKFAQIAQTDLGYTLYTSGPIYSDDGETLVGVVLVGSLLESFLPVAKSEALADITVYDFEGSPLATTFATDGADGEADLAPDDQALAASSATTAVRETKELFGRDFDLLYGELTVRDQIVGVYSVALPSSFILSAGGSTRWQMGALFALGTAAVLLTGWLLAGSLTRPLLKLVGTARAVSAGDLTARAGVHTSDEVGVLATSFDAMTEKLQRQHLATVRALTSAVDARDPYTAGHSARVGQLAVMIGEALELPDSQIQHLEIGGYLHDIGKIGVRDAVLLKPGRLTPAERELIERHPAIGLDILKPVELAPEVIAFVTGHHEKLDGSGYPDHRRGNELSIVARIATIADIYDALTTDRPYRAGMSVDEALTILAREALDGKLDSRVLTVFEGLVDEWERRRRTEPDLQGFRLPEYPLHEAA
jgi:putative nucleotidyltransferase with HDIG domain